MEIKNEDKDGLKSKIIEEHSYCLDPFDSKRYGFQKSFEDFIRKESRNDIKSDILMTYNPMAPTSDAYTSGSDTDDAPETEEYFDDNTAIKIEDIPIDDINTLSPEDLPQITSVFSLRAVDPSVDIPSTSATNQSLIEFKVFPQKLNTSDDYRRHFGNHSTNDFPISDDTIAKTQIGYVHRLCGRVFDSLIERNRHQISCDFESIGQKTSTPLTLKKRSKEKSKNTSKESIVSKQSRKCNDCILESSSDPIPKDINNTNSDKNFNDKKWIAIGSQVLSRWTDGLFYLGFIEKIRNKSKKCLIRFEDNSLHWIRFEDLHKQLTSDESDFYCAICSDGTSDAPNAIVICDVCNNGYHQRCHKPCIGDEILEPNIPFVCRLCLSVWNPKEDGVEKDSVMDRTLEKMKMEFPYDLNGLDWDDFHQTNSQQKYCYCGGDGHYYSKMLQCYSCMQWFHEACIQALETPLLYGDHYFTFECSVCAKGKEQLTRIIMKWTDMVALVINNLALQHKKRLFSLTTDIVPFIQNNSNLFKTSEELQKLNEWELEGRVSAVLKSNFNRFINGREVGKLADLWALRMSFPFKKPLIFAPPLALPTPPISVNRRKRGRPKKGFRSNSLGSSTGSLSYAVSTSSTSSRCSQSNAIKQEKRHFSRIEPKFYEDFNQKFFKFY